METGVEHMADIVCFQEPQRERGSEGISHSAYEIRAWNGVWTVIRKGSGLVVHERTDLSREVNDDVIATDVRRRGEKTTRIVNIYDQRDTWAGERMARKLSWQRVIRQGGLLLAGDFNAPSSQWDSRCRVQRNTTLWEDVIDENGLEVGNDGQPTHYWTREDHERESVIDLTLANPAITKRFILADDHTAGSDHKVIEWEVEADRHEVADHERVVGWNLAAMTSVSNGSG